MRALLRPDPPCVGWLQSQPGQDLHLLAGQLWFGGEARSVRTLLGSCVAITLWHPSRRIGGMCHFLLPHRKRTFGEPRDARFGDEAMEVLAEVLARAGTRPQEYEVHLYGGADTMPGQAMTEFSIGERNIEEGWSLIDHYGFALQGVDVGEHLPRHVKLTLDAGEVCMRRGENMSKKAA